MDTTRSETVVGWMRVAAVLACMFSTLNEYLFWQQFMGEQAPRLSVIGGNWALLIPSLVVLGGTWWLALRLSVVWHLLLAFGLCIVCLAMVGTAYVAIFPPSG